MIALRTVLLASLAATAGPAFAATPPAAPPAPPAPVAPAAPVAPPAPANPVADTADTERQLADARERLDQAAHEVAELSQRLGNRFGDRFFRVPMGPPARALLGVQIERERGRDGVRVVEVSPGGPAEKAGLKSGDVITAVAGADLTRGGSSEATMMAKMRELDPGKPVKVRLQRDGKTREVELTPMAAPPPVAQRFTFERREGPGGERPGPLPPGALFVNPGMVPEIRPFPGERDRDERRDLRDSGGDRIVDHGFAGMELATLSPDLGRYFNAKEGVLVVRAGREDALKLKDGDVITAIDGRAPNSASHATRILRSYQRGEKLKLTVLRDRKAVTLDVTLPGG